MTQDNYSGAFDACGHRVSFYFDTAGITLPEGDDELLDEAAESRAREMIAQDFTSGELCAYIGYDAETDVRGWWKIERA